jgi:capsule polysaccharide export protein KpsE/RkpR
MSEVKRVREMEELIGLQANAIQALQQAAQALQIALQALEKARADKGEQQKIIFVPQPAPPAPTCAHQSIVYSKLGYAVLGPWGKYATENI